MKTIFNPFTGTLDYIGGYVPAPFPPHIITNSTPLRSFDCSSISLDELANVLATVINDLSIGLTLPAYTISNMAVLRVMDANSVTLDELANVLATLISDLTSFNQYASYSISNVTTDRDFDATNTSIDEVANVLGTLVGDLQIQQLIGNVYSDYYLLKDEAISTVFNMNGTILDTFVFSGITALITFNPNGTITEQFSYPISKIKTTIFNLDGSITETLS
jgi:hypothetical protein